MAAKVGKGGLGRLGDWSKGGRPGCTLSVTDSEKPMFTRPNAEKDNVGRARLRNSILKPGCKKSETGVKEAKRSKPKTGRRLLAQEKLCNEQEGPMCRRSDASRRDSDLETSVTNKLAPRRPMLRTEGDNPSERGSISGAAGSGQTRLRARAAEPKPTKSDAEGKKPKRTWPQAKGAKPVRAKLCTAMLASGQAHPKGEEHKPNCATLRTEKIEPR